MVTDAAARAARHRRARGADRLGLRRPRRRRRRRRRSWTRPCATCTTACRSRKCTSAAILAARTLIEKDPGLQLRHRAPAAAHDPPRGARRGSDRRRRWRRATPSTSRTSSARASTPSCSTRSSLQFDLKRLGAALKPERDLQFDYLGLQTLYDRYFLHIDDAAHRAAAGVLHARGDGPGAERDRPRGARDRVLQRAVDLRLHELDADAVQLRHAALAALVAAT